LRECVRLAREEQRVVVFVEPIALYMTRDLHAPKDGLWSHPYPEPGTGDPIPLGRIGQHGEGAEIAILSYANGYHLSRQAEAILREDHGVKARIIDLRWLAPLDEAAILAAVRPCPRVLIVDECRITGSQSEALMALITERAGHAPSLRRIAAADSFIATGPAYGATLPSRDAIVETALDMLG
ncbi:MAG: MFS transporter, partial [Proteobacteria bacterium]|nr:MFS transporter [Pseudomonadota bacterium]